MLYFACARAYVCVLLKYPFSYKMAYIACFFLPLMMLPLLILLLLILFLLLFYCYCNCCVSFDVHMQRKQFQQNGILIIIFRLKWEICLMYLISISQCIEYCFVEIGWKCFYNWNARILAIVWRFGVFITVTTCMEADSNSICQNLKVNAMPRYRNAAT